MISKNMALLDNYGGLIKFVAYTLGEPITKQYSKTCPKNATYITANIYLFKVNNRNNRRRCEICTELTIKTLERCQ